MSVTFQLLLGSALLCICALVQIGVLVIAAGLLRRLDERLRGWSATGDAIVLVVVAYLALAVAHSTQVWLWAWSFAATGALPDMQDALYFALITYTTVGYGDVTLGPDLRLFAAMAAVTGVLNFGLSAAFVVALMGRLFARMKL